VNILNSLLSYVLLYKYAAIALIIYIAAVIVPLPVNATLLAVGAFASRGYISFWLSLLVAAIFSTLGDLTDYGITRKYGEKIVRALHFHKFKFYDQLQEELKTDAAITVFTTRFGGSLSIIANFLSGLVRVPLRTFFISDFVANIIEPFGALGIGYLVGDYWSDFSGILEITTAIIAVAVVTFIFYRMYRRMVKRLAHKQKESKSV
jgi:membrane protein DedA with SNARE-associated domain